MSFAPRSPCAASRPRAPRRSPPAAESTRRRRRGLARPPRRPGHSDHAADAHVEPTGCRTGTTFAVNPPPRRALSREAIACGGSRIEACEEVTAQGPFWRRASWKVASIVAPWYLADVHAGGVHGERGNGSFGQVDQCRTRRRCRRSRARRASSRSHRSARSPATDERLPPRRLPRSAAVIAAAIRILRRRQGRVRVIIVGLLGGPGLHRGSRRQIHKVDPCSAPPRCRLGTARVRDTTRRYLSIRLRAADLTLHPPSRIDGHLFRRESRASGCPAAQICARSAWSAATSIPSTLPARENSSERTAQASSPYVDHQSHAIGCTAPHVIAYRY